MNRYGNSKRSFLYFATATRTACFGVALVFSLFVLESRSDAVDSASCVKVPAGLIAWWTGDGNANDTFGPSHGALANGATFVDGMVGQAFAFDGVDSAVTTSAQTLNSNYTALTIEAWLFPLSHGHGHGCPVKALILVC